MVNVKSEMFDVLLVTALKRTCKHIKCLLKLHLAVMQCLNNFKVWFIVNCVNDPLGNDFLVSSLYNCIRYVALFKYPIYGT